MRRKRKEARKTHDVRKAGDGDEGNEHHLEQL
jgi:hypothetical protein